MVDAVKSLADDRLSSTDKGKKAIIMGQFDNERSHYQFSASNPRQIPKVSCVEIMQFFLCQKH